ncbi:hypothetical protein [Actinoplanes subtropicus]|uniref:hypothetical protein n=1 Tax=Actinoplanes subtropicus TaxID=543632 RepID=UPI00068CB16F|nr:hypothetical protein [Actinoplanes subtropicus]
MTGAEPGKQRNCSPTSPACESAAAIGVTWPRRAFDLLVLDGGGQGKADEPPLRPADWLRSDALVVIDDFTASRSG